MWFIIDTNVLDFNEAPPIKKPFKSLIFNIELALFSLTLPPYNIYKLQLFRLKLLIIFC